MRLFLSDEPERLEVEATPSWPVLPVGSSTTNWLAGTSMACLPTAVWRPEHGGQRAHHYFAEPDTVPRLRLGADVPLPLPRPTVRPARKSWPSTVPVCSPLPFSAPSGRFSDLAALDDHPLDGALDAAHLPGFVLRSRPDSAQRGSAAGAESLPIVPWQAPPDSLRPSAEEPIVYSSADSILFHVREEQVSLHGEAKVETAGIELTAAEVDYFAGDRIIEAAGCRTAPGRCRETGLHPGRQVVYPGRPAL